MQTGPTVASRLAAALRTVLGAAELPWRLRAWDGSQAGPAGAPVLVVRSPMAVRRLAWAPGELGLARAYVAGDIDIEGDVYATLDAIGAVTQQSSSDTFARPTAREWVGLARTAAALGAVGPPPAPPPEEYRHPRRSRLHTLHRDAAAVSHHYDVGNEFYALVLGPTLVYSCAVWTDEGTGLDAAQLAKLDLVCRKLGLGPGMRLLDVGCGWGSLALHAAREHGADVVGITLSEEQAALARQRVAEAGLDGADHDPGPGLPRGRRRTVRRGELGRDGRARRPGRATDVRRRAARPPGPRRTAAAPRHLVVGRGRRAGTTTRSSPATCSPTAS